MTKKITQLLKKSKSFLISTHVNPDPDAICSEMALALYLKSLGKKVFVVNEAPLPARFLFLPQTKIIKGADSVKRISYDVAIVVDCGELSRVGKVRNILQKDKPIVNIDHHITNRAFGDYNIVFPNSSSTAEILYDFLKQANCRFSKDIALHLYAGIMTDTGSFRYDNTTAKTHQIAGELLKFGFSANKLYRNIYERMLLKDVQLFTSVINSFDSLYQGKVLCVNLKKSAATKFSDEFDLRDTIFRFLRSIKGVEVIVIFTEAAKNKTRLNFRSSGRINVAKVAHEFQGGGHKKASGGVIDKPLRHAREEVLKVIKKQL